MVSQVLPSGFASSRSIVLVIIILFCFLVVRELWLSLALIALVSAYFYLSRN